MLSGVLGDSSSIVLSYLSSSEGLVGLSVAISELFELITVKVLDCCFLFLFPDQQFLFFLLRCLDSVPLTAIEYFKESAQLLIEEKGPVNALAAALAHISGATSIEQRSLLNSDVVSVYSFNICLGRSKNEQLAPRCLNGELFVCLLMETAFKLQTDSILVKNVGHLSTPVLL